MAGRSVGWQQAGGAQRTPQRLQRILRFPLARVRLGCRHRRLRPAHRTERAGSGAGLAGPERVHAAAGGLAVPGGGPGRTGGLGRTATLTARMPWASRTARTAEATGTARTIDATLRAGAGEATRAASGRDAHRREAWWQAQHRTARGR